MSLEVQGRQARAPAPQAESQRPALVLVGLESSGKSAVFRALTGASLGDEANFRGSTVFCRRSRAAHGPVEVIDTPGIRFDEDNLTTRLALAEVADAEVVLLVVRATHARTELGKLLEGLGGRLLGRRFGIVLTFEDRSPPGLGAFAQETAALLGVPVISLDARRPKRARCEALTELALTAPRSTVAAVPPTLPPLAAVDPRPSWFESKTVGPPLAALAILAIYGGPVYLAYWFSQALQPLVDAAVIEPVKAAVNAAVNAAPGATSLLSDLLVGSYGVVTLGWYSFLWAFPVVLLLGASVAVTDEIGLRDRITAALDPALRHIGLEGRDLTAVLTGFGCNVVAVVQSRSCGACTRKACVSLITFGAACSYQMGAALSLFGTAGRPRLFLPYLGTLFVVGALHTRLWNRRALPPRHRLPLAERAFLQAPSLAAVRWKILASARQFLLQAMPIFLGICVVAALLSHAGLMDRAAAMVAPVLDWFGLPAAVAPGVVFSVLRKDGLLVLNQDGGTLVRGLTATQMFVTVYLSSALTACLVTLWTVRREVGLRFALTLAFRQAVTAAGSAWLLAWALKKALS